jgi:hypothetical protein
MCENTYATVAGSANAFAPTSVPGPSVKLAANRFVVSFDTKRESTLTGNPFHVMGVSDDQNEVKCSCGNAT